MIFFLAKRLGNGTTKVVCIGSFYSDTCIKECKAMHKRTRWTKSNALICMFEMRAFPILCYWVILNTNEQALASG